MPWRGSDPIQDSFVTLPLNYLTVSGPFLVLVLVPLWLGLAREGAALRATLPIEVMTGLGAITPAEALALADPGLRLGERLLAARRLGPRGYLRLGRLHAAQLDLAMERWNQARGESAGGPEREARLRRQVLALKDRLHAAGKGRD
jgi:hypothetical protein